MTKILDGLVDALNGNISRVTFAGIDLGGKDWNAICCPRCKTPHRFRKRVPKKCRICDLPFRFTANVAGLSDGERDSVANGSET